MAKKRQRATQVSKGERRCVNAAMRKGLRIERREDGGRMMNQFKAWKEGRPVSKKTLLMYGARNTGETVLFNKLRKAVEGLKREMDVNRAIKGVS